MNILEGAVGASLAQDTIYHLFDPSRRSGERDMRRYLHEVRYLEVLKTATELGISSLQLLTDCVLADGLDAGVVLSNGLQVDEGLAYMGIGEENTDSPSLLEHKHLREKTGERLIVVEKRAERMGKSVLEFVDDDADWDVRSMQASWRICEVSVEGNFRKNDGRPYSFHPLEATAMLYEAIKRAQETGVKIPRQDIVALLATCLMHDSVEDWVIKDEHYKLDPNVDVISPLLISRVLRKTGLRGSRPNYVATAVRLMMHEKGQPWMHTYEEYIPRPSSNFLSAIVKPSGDVLHNYQADRLPEPQQRDGETQEKFAERLKDYKSKQRHLASILFGDRMINAPNSKNAYHHDKRAVAYARPILYSARGIIEREGDRAKYPHVDWGRAVPIEKLKSEAMPELVETLQSDFQMPKTTL